MRRRLLAIGLFPASVMVAAGACGSSDNPTAPTDAGSDATAGLDATADHVRTPYDASGPPGVPRVPVTADLVTARVETQHLLFAAGEMQISGEPFAQFFAGRNLSYYDRTHLPTDQYLLPNGEDPKGVTDLFGFSTAVESYEYSKYHMNMVVQETGAGISLANGPLVALLPQATPQDRLIARVGQLLTAAGTDQAGYAVLPPPSNNPLNILGFAGLMPSFAPYKSFDPAMQPPIQIVQSCNRAGGYGGIPSLNQFVPEYECEYNQLNLTDAQLDRTLVPATLGFATWKEALWAIDFAGRLHDSTSNPVNAVADADRALVGTATNRVTGTDPPGAAAGTYLGSTPLEGMWGEVMVAAMDNLAALLVTKLTTADGTTLGGFATTLDALRYDYGSPLRWFPAASSVAVDTTQHFPTLTSITLTDATSRAEDLSALLLGNAMFFAMTDARNAAIGQRVGLELAFDGDPFPADNGVADGEETAHDRSLAVLRVAFIDLDRIHSDPTLGVLVDTATVSAGAVTRGSTVTTTTLGHSLIGLTQTLLSLNAAVTQYGGANPDASQDARGILNALPIHPIPGDAGAQPSFSARVRQLIMTNAAFVRDVLTTGTGQVANYATLTGGQATLSTDPTTLESQAAAVRALAEGFLVTGDETYRARARVVVQKLFSSFWSAPARMFRGALGGKDEVHMTPQRFAWIQSALRETHKVLSLPGDALLDRPALEDVIARVNKLYLNGWDDLDGNQVVAKSECLGARMQQAEQPLTGELGRDLFGLPTADRDNDCVPELGHAQRGSVLAGEVFFHSP